jgi:MFS transporter, DHA1 family, multidrug resistance protein
LHPDAASLWRGPRWTLAALLACLTMLGPFAVDTYLPAFTGIARSIDATPVQMQQTLSGYLFGFAAMSLFHGALADSFGRRPVVLWGVGLFALASVGCALSLSIGMLVFFRTLQGLAAGAGMIVSRALVRDMFPPADAQRVMSQVTIFFGIAPVIAPLVGGWLFVHAGWRAVFWFLAFVGALLWGGVWRFLPESLHISQVQRFDARNLMAGYRQMAADPRFMALVLASGVPFNGMFLYVLAAPTFLGRHLGLGPTQFFWFFVATIGGIMAGAWVSGRLAGRIVPRRQVRHGFVIMLVVSLLNVALSAVLPPHPAWAIAPVAVFAFGWSLMVPVVTLMVLDVVPGRRGMASSMQACTGAVASGLVAGVIAPLAMPSTLGLALASLGLLGVGIGAWLWVKPRLPSS